ncbi:nickel/cobalt efflux transporter [Halopseudomonas laoshanensis]|uniref:nickel/cobalt efflux transporter n=1 Tax=Halopseudomonas laoshanensis TaxID=2268758 RepID=UPI003736A41C
MSSFAELLQQGASQAWLYFPTAILLGALHGLEPGHSKTMMAAFIVAIRGTVKQAVLLGLAATLSHTVVVWLVAMFGMYLGENLDADTTEPYFQLASAAIIIIIALWMLWRTWRGEQTWQFEEASAHQHHNHYHEHEHVHSHDHIKPAGLELSLEGYQDAHERAHAQDIRTRFSNRNVSTGQIILFGLTGGLIPCPAAITVLLLCLQVKEVTLGAVLVLCFSIGLAITLVTVGAAAAIGARQASNRWPWLSTLARRAPYFSSVLIIGVGVYIGIHGWTGLNA